VQVLVVVLVCFLLDCANAAVVEKMVVARTRVVISLVIVVISDTGYVLKKIIYNVRRWPYLSRTNYYDWIWIWIKNPRQTIEPTPIG